MSISNVYKILVIFIILIFFLPSLVDAQDELELFRQGNASYRNGDFSQALDYYMEIYERGYESGSLYYNIGNCYYKQDDIGQAILFYERAKRLIPGDEELEFNLKLANLSVVDKIEPLPTFIIFRIFNDFVHLFPKKILIWIVASLYIVFITLLIIRILSRRYSLRRLLLRISIIVSVFLIIFGFSLYKQISEQTNHQEAVITAEQVSVKGAPSQGATTVFTLHEGTKVFIDKISGDWYEIVLADGKVGWVSNEILERI